MRVADLHDGNGASGGASLGVAPHVHDKHAGHDPEMFRRRFWLTLVAHVPVVVTSEMIMDWFGYDLAAAWLGSARCSARSSSCGVAGRSSAGAVRRSATGRRG